MSLIRVADLLLQITSADKDFFDKRFNDYLTDSSDKPDMVMTTALYDVLPIPEGEEIAEIGGSKLIKADDGRVTRYNITSRTDRVPFTVTYNEDYSFITISIQKNLFYKGINATDWEYVLTGFMFANRIAYLGGTVLHASAISYCGKGIAFSADPGTGKSTHTSLWQKKFGGDVCVVNDDKPALRFIDGKPYIYGTPWSGKTSLNNNIKVPLFGIVFLEQNEENIISPLKPSEIMFNLNRQLPSPFYDASIGIKTIELIKKLYYLNLPIFKLGCNISDQAVDTVYNKLFGGNL